jgi:deoxyhypusine synthase
MKPLRQIRLKEDMRLSDLVDAMEKCGVLGAGRFAKGVRIMADMFKDPDYTVFLSLAGPMVPSGSRNVISYLVEHEYINVILSTGANLVHDIIESMGYRHYIGSFYSDDYELKKNKLGRIGDIFVEQEAFVTLEKKIYQILDSLPKEKKEGMGIHELISELASKLDDPDSILVQARKHNVSVFAPGLLDSMLGLHIWTYSQLNKMKINPLADFSKLSDIVYSAKKVGVIIIGGGLPKHHTLYINTLRDGVDSAVQITLDRPEGGGLSGAPLEEAISWRKIKGKGKFVTIIGDATFVFPLMVTAALQAIHKQ